MKGDVVTAPSGESIVLTDVGVAELHDDAAIRVWDVSLKPAEQQPWHLHHNPYIVICLNGSAGRMDWLDGSEPRFLSEYRGGAVYRPVSPIHRLTNVGDNFYRTRLIELKDLGENLPEPFDIGPGARSIQGEHPPQRLPDGRAPVVLHDHVSIWTLELAGWQSTELNLPSIPHVLAKIDADDLDDDTFGGVRTLAGGPTSITNESNDRRTWFVVEFTYTQHLDSILKGGPR